MRTKLKKTVSLVIFSIALTLLSLGVYAQSTPDPMIEAFADFHFQNNQIFQDQTSQLFDYFESSDNSIPTDISSKFSPPLALDSLSCQENLSSSCLNYKFEENLNNLVPEIQKALNFVDVQDITNLSDTNALQSQQRFRFMQEQFEAAIDSTQSTLSFYQQLLQAYPMHLSYQATQSELDILINNLQELESYIKQYPSKYNHVTTPYCQ
jgi:hypothetical protein